MRVRLAQVARQFWAELEINQAPYQVIVSPTATYDWIEHRVQLNGGIHGSVKIIILLNDDFIPNATDATLMMHMSNR